MQTFREPTMDKLVNLYEGQVVADRVKIQSAGDQKMKEHFEAVLRQDKMILGALKCALAHGYSGEL